MNLDKTVSEADAAPELPKDRTGYNDRHLSVVLLDGTVEDKPGCPGSAGLVGYLP